MSNSDIPITDKMELFIEGYIVCALWSSTDDNGDPLDSNHDRDNIDDATMLDMVIDSWTFVKNNHHLINNAMTWSQAGHDFWLTRNGHGAGYWDRGLGEVGEQLSEAATAFGNVDLFVLDDGTSIGA